MRILFVIHTPKDPLTAVYGNTVGRARFIELRGHKVEILSPEDFPRLRRVPGRYFPIVYPVLIAFKLFREGQEYDLISFHSYAGWVFNLLRKLIPSGRKSRTMTVFHGLEPLYYEMLKTAMKRIGQPLSLRYRLLHGGVMARLIRWSCRRSDVIACLNNTEATYLVDHRWSYPSRIAITPNGISEDFFSERQWGNDTRRILFVGQWEERKGIRSLVEAFTYLARTKPELTLWCIGTLVETAAVLAEFPAEIRERVTVRPRVTQDEIKRAYKDADLFVFPSLFEGFSIALLEAMAAGLPIVTTPVGAAPDMLESEVNVLFVPENDAGALADAVCRLIRDATLRERLGRQAQKRAEEYRSERVYKNYLKLIEETVVGGTAKEYDKTMIEIS